MTNYPCVSIEVGSLVYKTLYWGTSWITESQWKKLLRRPVLYPLSLSPCGANTNTSLLCHFISNQWFYSTTLHLSNSFPVLWEALGDISMPDGAFLEIPGRSISRTSLAPSTTRTVLCRALRVLFHPGIPQAWPRHLLAFCWQSRSVSRGGLSFEEIKNSLLWIMGVI